MTEKKNDEKILLAVYGTLKENFPNYFYYLNPRKPIFKGITKIPYQMHSNKGFPLLFPSEQEHQIYVEIFEITAEILKKIDRLEGVPELYERKLIYFKEINDNAFIYIITNREPFGDLIEDGFFLR